MASIVDQETDARFWSQTHYAPGQKLDPNDPTDQAMIPVWKAIRAKVQREYDAGKLVQTFDHPTVTQNIAEAHAADQAAVANTEAAMRATDPAVQTAHVEAAAAANNVVKQKTNEAATVQPPSVPEQATQEASAQAQANPPPIEAHGKHHRRHGQAQAAHKPTPRNIIDKETDARFWSQVHYKPGQKLDPHDPLDATQVPVWNDINAKVKAEDAAGQLVITYNHPAIVQNIAEARAADKAAGAHLDDAAANPQSAPRNIVAATAASQASAQRTREVAQIQPPTVSPQIAHRAAQASAGVAVPPTGRDQLAMAQAQGTGNRAAEVHHHHQHRQRHGRRHHARSTVHSQNLQTYRAHAAQVAQAAGAPYVIVEQGPDGQFVPHPMTSRAELDAEYAKIAEHHDHRYVAAFDLSAGQGALTHDSVGVHAAEHADVPAGTTTTTTDTAPPASDTPQPSTPGEILGPKASSIGKILGIGAAVAAAAGLAYYVSKSKPKPRPRVLIATPPRRSAPRPMPMITLPKAP